MIGTMENRCDSVDALMYAYYEFMRKKKEENQMLEKNKDYLEMRVSSTDCALAQNEWAQVRVDGYVYTTYMNLPDPGELYIFISKEKFEMMQTEIEHYKRDVTRLQARADREAELARQRKINYDFLLKITGFDTVADLVDYLDYEAECDTLHEAVSKLKDQVKYTCDEWCSANSSNNSWKAAAECNSPKELIEKLNLLRDDISGRSTVIEHYKRDIEKWQKVTGCPTPEAAKALIESGMAYEHGYHEVQEENRKLTEEVDSWKNVTGYSIPEDYMHARISGAFHTPFDYTTAWQKATGCDTPEQAKERIKALNERIDESEADYNHLLCTTGFESEGEIEDALDKCDHSTLRKALVDYEFDYEELLKLTGYKSNQDIRVLLNDSEQFVYETMRELINSLKRQAKYTNLNWQNSTGFITPEKCSSYIDRLEKKLEDIKNLTEED